MKEHPILFSGPMVKAILENRKTQTRRTVKGLPDGIKCASAIPESDYQYRFTDFDKHTIDLRCPYGRPALPLEPAQDHLWVREGFAIDYEVGEGTRGEIPPAVFYRATDTETNWSNGKTPWKSPLFMPRWASRITLEIKDVRVERLQEISPTDVIAEGIGHATNCNSGLAKYPHGVPAEICAGRNCDCRVFREGWDSINGKRAPWASNPWVWIIEFRRIQPP